MNKKRILRKAYTHKEVYFINEVNKRITFYVAVIKKKRGRTLL